INSTYSSAISGVPTLSKVENLRMTNRGADFISVRWDKNESADGYMVYIYDGTKWTCVKTLTSASAVSHKITGLASGKAYKVTVKAYKTVNGKKFISDTVTISANTL
ncbi:MAG: fibronectin type III domain-containing protein, partial [Ruminiclostridium sp.]|nr:fibronectin type III domain-containing protein [Ruminiclostridium sp.]